MVCPSADIRIWYRITRAFQKEQYESSESNRVDFADAQRPRFLCLSIYSIIQSSGKSESRKLRGNPRSYFVAFALWLSRCQRKCLQSMRKYRYRYYTIFLESADRNFRTSVKFVARITLEYLCCSTNVTLAYIPYSSYFPFFLVIFFFFIWIYMLLRSHFHHCYLRNSLCMRFSFTLKLKFPQGIYKRYACQHSAVYLWLDTQW